MAHDYRHAEVFSPGTRPLPFWLWLFAVLTISGFVGLIYYLDQYEKGKITTTPTEQSGTQSSTSAQTKDNDAEQSKSRFDFYKLLPKVGVDVPKEGTKPGATSSAATTAPVEQKPKTSSINYVLQAGSFREYREADKLKASLALSGIEANIEKVTLKGSEVWHRVRIGPIASEREMNRIRSRLREKNIEPVTLKVKG